MKGLDDYAVITTFHSDTNIGLGGWGTKEVDVVRVGPVYHRLSGHRSRFTACSASDADTVIPRDLADKVARPCSKCPWGE